MLFTQYYLDCLSQASYLIGDESTGQAVVVDPRRDVAEYLDDAAAKGLRIVGVINTHFHADFVSGHLELARETGAWIGYGEAASASFPIRHLADGERISLGEVTLQVMATPGHTPESISVLVFEHPGDDTAYGVLTGDALFIGDVGRPDLLASVGVTADELGRMLYDSVQHKLMSLPDEVRVFPAHGAGSACGKNLSTERQSTIGNQRAFNYACQPMTEEQFLAVVTEGQPAAPGYFVYNATLNKRDREVRDLDATVPALTDGEVEQALAAGAALHDARDVQEFAAGHLRGSVNVPADGRMAETVGMVFTPDQQVVIIAPEGTEQEVATRFARIGFDNVLGYVPDPEAFFLSHQDLVERASRLPAVEADDAAGRPDVQVVDIRNAGEVVAGMVPGARHIPLAELSARADAAPARPTGARPVRLGLRQNLGQFTLLVAVNALVGGMLGQERTVVPLMASRVFGLPTYTAALTFVLAFGVSKAATNYLAGTWSDRFGRKPVLVAGWLVAVPVPLLLIWAPSWGWVVAANVLLGISQGLTWSTTVVMKIDLVGPARRGLAMGLNESAGYLAVAVTALATGYLAQAHGLRPAPFLLGLAYAALGLGASALFVRETRDHARLEASRHVARADGRHDHLHGDLTDRQVFVQTSFKEPALSAASQAGLVNNLNDGLAWGLFPVLFAAGGLSVARIGALAALYPAVWGLGQLVTGALSDRWGRKWLIAGGMVLQGLALALVAAGTTFAGWAAAAALLGLGTAMVYPTLLAAIGDVAHPRWRARSVGVYRLWRDGGFAAGAVLAGVLADAVGLRPAIWVVAALTAASGGVVAVRMYETLRPGPAAASTT